MWNCVSNTEEGLPHSNDQIEWMDTNFPHSKLKIADCRLQIAVYCFQITDYSLHIADYRLCIAVYRLQFAPASWFGFECETQSGIESETESVTQCEIV